MYVVAFGFDHTPEGAEAEWAQGWRAYPLHPCGQLTRCVSAVAELLVCFVFNVIFGLVR